MSLTPDIVDIDPPIKRVRTCIFSSSSFATKLSTVDKRDSKSLAGDKIQNESDSQPLKFSTFKQNFSHSIPSILSIPDVLLCDALSFLDCQSLTRVSSVCASFNSTAQSIMKSTVSFTSALSCSKDVYTALSECIKYAIQRSSVPPNHAYLFISAKYSQAAVSAALRIIGTMLPNSLVLAGCHCIGMIGRCVLTGTLLEVDGLRKSPRYGVSLALVHLPNTTPMSQFVSLLHREAPVLHDNITLRNALGIKDPEIKSQLPESVVVLSYPVQDTSRLLARIGDMLPEATVTGAISSGARPRTIQLFTKANGGPVQCHTEGAILFSMHKKVESEYQGVPLLSAFASRGCKAISAVYEIVDSLGDNILSVRSVGDTSSQRHSLHYRPVQSIFAILQDLITSNQINGLFVGISAEQYTVHGRILCDIMLLDECSGMGIDTASIGAYTSVGTALDLRGMYLQFYELEQTACKTDLAARMKYELCGAHTDHNGNPIQLNPRGALLFTCAGRGEEFYGVRNVDTSLIEAGASTRFDVCGFFCNGEIGPPARSAQLEGGALQYIDHNSDDDNNDSPPLLLVDCDSIQTQDTTMNPQFADVATSLEVTIDSLDESELKPMRGPLTTASLSSSSSANPNTALSEVTDEMIAVVESAAQAAIEVDWGGVSFPAVMQSFTAVLTLINAPQ